MRQEYIEVCYKFRIINLSCTKSSTVENGGKRTVNCIAQNIIRSSQKIHRSDLAFYNIISITFTAAKFLE